VFFIVFVCVGGAQIKQKTKQKFFSFKYLGAIFGNEE